MTFDRCLTQNNIFFVLYDIGNNKIIGTVPEILGKLRKLETFDCTFSHARKEY